MLDNGAREAELGAQIRCACQKSAVNRPTALKKRPAEINARLRAEEQSRRKAEAAVSRVRICVCVCERGRRGACLHA